MRISAIVILMLLALHAPLWFFVLAALLYALVVESPYELLILAVCLDAAFSDPARAVWCAYTLSAAIVIAAVACVRPYFTFYKTYDF